MVGISNQAHVSDANCLRMLEESACISCVGSESEVLDVEKRLCLVYVIYWL
jgi:hypothetical protein